MKLHTSVPSPTAPTTRHGTVKVMWLNDCADFTEQACETGQIDVSLDDPAAELFAVLDRGHWSAFFEVVPRSDLGLLLVRRRTHYHSSSENMFWDALWAMLRLHSKGGCVPLGCDTTTEFFELLVCRLRQ